MSDKKFSKYVKNLSDLSDEELLKHEKQQKSLTGIITGMVIAVVIAGIYLFFKNDFSAAGISIICSITLLLSVSVYPSVNEIKKEKAKRNL